ncbi:MAG: hypothetical protein GXP53_11945 [Deltaproteobacteria bacterium]|nr:hypothetical protein [Deltaproteobacteria bacterium]
MKRDIISKFIITLLFGGLCIYGAACSHIRTPSLNSPDIRVERLSQKGVNISEPKIYLTDGLLVVSGTMKKSGIRSRLYGHADIVIVNSSDSIVAKKNAILFRTQRSRIRYEYNYTAEFPFSSSVEGLSMRIAYHRPGYDSFYCGYNPAQ